MILVPGSVETVHASGNNDALVQKLKDGDYSRRGADVCLGCHDETYPFPVDQVFLNAHGKQIHGTPFSDNQQSEAYPAGLQCEACHGPAGEHATQVLAEQVPRQPMINFGKSANAGADLQNSMCLNCHQDQHRYGWEGSAHEAGDVSCADCHNIHSDQDPVVQQRQQAKTCNQCHTDVAADIAKHSSHPIRQGQLVCVDCHQVHGTDTSGLLAKGDANDTCFACHAEKRGPFLFEHEPVAEDCGICHAPHGASQPALLVRRPPQLCQGCHSAAGHRNLPQMASQVPPEGSSEYLLLRGCLNCHSQVHGSNHPSGDKLRR
jgi:DmsE family decaheme c-type cytochrome